MLSTIFTYHVLLVLLVWAVFAVLALLGFLAWISSYISKADPQANAALLAECEALQAQAEALQARHTSRLRGI